MAGNDGRARTRQHQEYDSRYPLPTDVCRRCARTRRAARGVACSRIGISWANPLMRWPAAHWWQRAPVA